MEGVEDYVNASGLQRKEALDMIKEFSDDITNMHGRCIDIGCGPGSVTKHVLLPRLPSEAVLVGADILQTMVDYANENSIDEDRLSYIKLDIETDELPKEEIGRYDNAFSCCCLHWCHNTKQTYDNIYSLLRPGGKVLIMLMCFNDAFDVNTEMSHNPQYKAHMQNVANAASPFHDSPNPSGSLKKILREAGFEVIHCSNREKWFVHADVNSYHDHVMSVNAFYKKMPAYLKEQYKQEVTNELTNRKILYKNKNSDRPNEHCVLDRYNVLIAYFRKPKI